MVYCVNVGTLCYHMYMYVAIIRTSMENDILPNILLSASVADIDNVLFRKGLWNRHNFYNGQSNTERIRYSSWILTVFGSHLSVGLCEPNW